MALDVALQKSFGFGLGMNRGRGHLNYEQSWELGNCYGIFATGGHSVGGTSMVTLSGEGCCVISDWLAVYDFLVDYRARITRIDLAHDDYRGRITLPQLREWFEAGDFATERGDVRQRAAMSTTSVTVQVKPFMSATAKMESCCGSMKKGSNSVTRRVTGYAGRSNCTTRIG